MRTNIQNAAGLINVLSGKGCKFCDVTNEMGGSDSFEATVIYGRERAFRIFANSDGSGYVEDIKTYLKPETLIELSNLIQPYTVAEKHRVHT